VTHDQVEAMTLADRIVILKGGEIEQCGTPDEVYNTPASVFVGGFVGSPAMNFVKADLDEGSLVFANGDRLQVPQVYAARAANLKRRDVIVGVRPEHFVMGDASAPQLNCRVQVVEPLGADTLLFLALGEGSGSGAHGAGDLVARVPPHVRPAPGSAVSIGIDPMRLHLFDPETQKAIA
jgi:multiple sugar transport system ATP-binding protein